MNAKEKATELINKFFLPLDESIQLNFVGKRKEHAKQCALICAEEIIESVKFYSDAQPLFWEEVKQELIKL